jgi:hypothetical protein
VGRPRYDRSAITPGTSVFGDDLPRNARSVAALRHDVAAIADKGSLAALHGRLSGPENW